MDWIDFNLGIVVDTPDGKGVIDAVIKTKNQIDITLLENGDTKSYKLSDISSSFGQLKLSACSQIGQFILLFQRLENRLRDFLNHTLSLNSNQRKELTSSFTAGKLKSQIDSIFDKHGQEHKVNWNKISSQIASLTKLRNTLVHGYLFHYNEKYELDYNSLYFENSNGKVEILTWDKLQQFTVDCLNTYYEANDLFQISSEVIREKIKKEDTTSTPN